MLRIMLSQFFYNLSKKMPVLRRDDSIIVKENPYMAICLASLFTIIALFLTLSEPLEALEDAIFIAILIIFFGGYALHLWLSLSVEITVNNEYIKQKWLFGSKIIRWKDVQKVELGSSTNNLKFYNGHKKIEFDIFMVGFFDLLEYMKNNLPKDIYKEALSEVEQLISSYES